MPEGFIGPDSTGMISHEALLHNLSLTDSVVGTIPGEELEQYISLIPDAANGEKDEGRNIAADAGSSVLACYLYDQEKEAYQYIFLAQSGDWEQFNTSPEAETLVTWMLEFGVFWLSE